MGIFTPRSKAIFSNEELECFNAFADKTTSKKSDGQRRLELLKMTLKPMEAFFEEHL